MTRAQMQTMLGVILNDPDSVRFDADTRDTALNHTVLSFVQKLPVSLLGEIYEKCEGKQTGAGIDNSDTRRTRLTKTETSLFNPQAVRYISGCYRKIASPYTEYWFDEVLSNELYTLNNNLLANSYKSPRIEESKTYLYLYPQRPDGYYIDINYLRAPATISASQDCDLNVLLHSLIVTYTGFILKGNPEDAEQSLRAYLEEKGVVK